MTLKDNGKAVAAMGFGSAALKLLDLTSGSWTEVIVSQPRVHARMVSYRGEAFVIGGQGHDFGRPESEVFRLDRNGRVTLEQGLRLTAARTSFLALRVERDMCKVSDI